MVHFKSSAPEQEKAQLPAQFQLQRSPYMILILSKYPKTFLLYFSGPSNHLSGQSGYKWGTQEPGSQPVRLSDRPFLPLIPRDMEARLSWSEDYHCYCM